MRKHFLGAVAVAIAVLAGFEREALADSVGKTLALIDQALGGHVDGSGATTGQALVKQSDGSWKPGSVSSSQTLAQTLANGADANSVAITGLRSLTFASGLGSIDHLIGPSDSTFQMRTPNAGAGATARGMSFYCGVGDNGSGAGGAEIDLSGGSPTGGGTVTISSGAGSGTNGTIILNPAGGASGVVSITGTATWSESANLAFGTTTGTKIGTSTSQKIGFFNATPVVQQTGGSDILASLVNLGLRAASSNPPLNMGTGALTAGASTFGVGTVSANTPAITTSETQNATSGTVNLLTFAGTFADGGTTSTTVARGLYLNPTVNYTAASKTGTFRAFQVDVVETSNPSGGTSIILCRGGAAGTTTAFNADSSGNAQAANFQATSTGSFAFSSSTTVSGTSDTFISRSSANNFKFGNAIGDQTAGMFCGNINTGGNATTGIDIQSSASAKATFGSAAWIVFTNGTNGSGTADTGISRSAAGTVAVGTGAQGSTAGTLSLTSVILQSGGGLSFRGAAAGTDRITWGTGGTFASGTPEILGPSDQDLWITPATPGSAGAGRSIQLTGGTPNGANVGGDIRLTAGPAASGATGGQVVSLAGTGGSSNGSGGSSSFTAGTGGGAGGGGICTVAGGAGGASGGPGGACTAQGGNGNSSGTDQAAGGLTLSTGLGTGQSTADIVAQTGYKLASGTTLQTAYDRLRVTSKTFTGSTTTATADLFLVASCAVSNSGIGVEVHYLIEVADGSNHVSSISGTMVVAASNRVGTVLATCTTAGTSNQQISDTTTFTSLAATTTATVSGTNVQLKVTPSWGAGTPTSVKITYQARAEGQTALTPQ